MSYTQPTSTLASDRPWRDLRPLPKAELHLHLLAALRPATLTVLAAQERIIAPHPRRFRSFAEFQALFPAFVEVVQARPANLRRLVREMVADAALEGVVWLQPQFNPYTFHKLGSPEDVLDLVLDAAREEGVVHGVGVGLTLAASRHRGPQAALTLARLAASYSGRGVYALGLTGDEEAFGPELFTEAFAIARDAGLTVAPHAGELAGAQSVRSAVVLLGATRIAHGVRAAEDPEVLALLAEREVSLDVCLSSNRILGVVSDLRRHPLAQLLAAGVRCSLGTDDPLMFGASLLDEYQTARSTLALTDRQIAEIALTSIETSDAPAEVITAAREGVNEWIRATP